jgi:hypothetical protein
VWELRWVLGRILGSLVGYGRERSNKITGGANGGRRWVAGLLGCVRKNRQGGFIGPVARRGGFAPPSWPTGAPAWARWRCASDRRPMVDGGSPAGECAQAAWHRPRLPAHIIGPRCTVASARASDRWVLRRLSVRVRPGCGEADVVGARRDVARGFAQFKQNSST